MALLSRPLQLHDVRDVERLAQSVLTRSGLTLNYHDREEVLVYLIEEAWQASTEYDASRGTTFSTHCTTILQRRVIDWQRKKYGRTVWKFKGGEYRRELPAVVSLNGGLVDAEPARGGDPADGGATDLARLLAGGARTRAGDLETLRLGTHGRATRGA